MSSASSWCTTEVGRIEAISLVYRTKGRGPRTLPWGTLLEQRVDAEMLPPIRTRCERSDRKLLNRDNTRPRQARLKKLGTGTRWACCTRSKAFDRSTMTTPVNLRSAFAISHLLMARAPASSVEHWRLYENGLSENSWAQWRSQQLAVLQDAWNNRKNTGL